MPTGGDEQSEVDDGKALKDDDAEMQVENETGTNLGDVFSGNEVAGTLLESRGAAAAVADGDETGSAAARKESDAVEADQVTDVAKKREESLSIVGKVLISMPRAGNAVGYNLAFS